MSFDTRLSRVGEGVRSAELGGPVARDWRSKRVFTIGGEERGQRSGILRAGRVPASRVGPRSRAELTTSLAQEPGSSTGRATTRASTSKETRLGLGRLSRSMLLNCEFASVCCFDDERAEQSACCRGSLRVRRYVRLTDLFSTPTAPTEVKSAELVQLPTFEHCLCVSPLELRVVLRSH